MINVVVAVFAHILTAWRARQRVHVVNGAGASVVRQLERRRAAAGVGLGRVVITVAARRLFTAMNGIC